MKTLLICLLTAGSWFAQTPEIDLSATSWDFGQRRQGEKDVRSITVRNSGTGNLAIRKVGVTCGCISAAIDRDLIEPGGTATLTINLDTTRVQGRIHKQVFIESNLPAGRVVQVQVYGNIEAAWWLSTRTLNLGFIDRGKVATGEFRIEVRPGTVVDLATVQTSSPRLQSQFEAFGAPDDAHGYLVRVTTTDDLPIGPFSGNIVVRMKNDPRDTDHVTVRFEVQGSIIVEPSSINFGQIDADDVKSATLTVTNRDDQVLSIEKIVCHDGQVATSIKEIEEGRRFEVTVVVTPASGRRAIGSHLFIVTNQAEQKMIRVPYRASIRMPAPIKR